ncbi:NAD(P)-dependent oxidoreductase [Ferrimonas lipolytica]|uniref:NAD(P)-dependent oxidoreductase n=1 Tax=Ferrimonas lipolytica TaxID=2724191 RepID=A0A6H1UET9_9GAMM|nr:NAD(P)-dependent oxidoreductase [Ferrimonas lipolytica]QIZ76312.1 NAD(P)-dependent oxidoreductase [Ferrimonas lipolytica]
MMPITLTQPLRVLVVGGGRAASIKARTALRYNQQVTLLSPALTDDCIDLDCVHIEADLYQCDDATFVGYDLVYLALPWPQQLSLQLHLTELASRLIAKGALLCVSCQPRLGNFVNPCSRSVGDNVLALSGSGRNPRQTRKHTIQLAHELIKIQRGLCTI